MLNTHQIPATAAYRGGPVGDVALSSLGGVSGLSPAFDGLSNPRGATVRNVGDFRLVGRADQIAAQLNSIIAMSEGRVPSVEA